MIIKYFKKLEKVNHILLTYKSSCICANFVAVLYLAAAVQWLVIALSQ